MSGKEVGYTRSRIALASGDKGLPGSQSKTNFRAYFGENLQKVKRISIVSVSFPNNAWNVNSEGGGANNGYAIDSGGTVAEFSADPGFRTTATLMSEVEDSINDYLTSLGDGQSIAIIQDTTTQLVEIKYNPGTGPVHIDLLDSETNSGVWELLGFTSLPLRVSTVVVAPSLPSLGGLKTVYLMSSRLAPGNMIDAQKVETEQGTTYVGTQKNTLLTIPITAPFGVSNVFECKVDALCQLTPLTPLSCTDVDFQLTDKEGNVIDLHGGNLVINLRFWFDRF